MPDYTIHHQGANCGPFSGEELAERMQRGEFSPGTLAWRPGLAEWGPLDRVLAADGVIAPALPRTPLPPRVFAPASPIPAKPYNWLIPAILSTLCGCLPLGIVAIVFAAKVDGKHAAGDHAGAKSSANTAMILTIISACCIVISIGFYAALAIPAFKKVRNNAIEKIMVNDARVISSATRSVMAEQAKDNVTVGQIRPLLAGARLSSGVTLVVKGLPVEISGGAADSVVLRQAGKFTLRHEQYDRRISSNGAIVAQPGATQEITFEVDTADVVR